MRPARKTLVRRTNAGHVSPSDGKHKQLRRGGPLRASLVRTPASSQVALVYLQLVKEDHRWWWRSFLSGGSTGMFIYGYSFFYFFYHSEMSGLLQVTRSRFLPFKLRVPCAPMSESCNVALRLQHDYRETVVSRTRMPKRRYVGTVYGFEVVSVMADAAEVRFWRNARR